MSLVDRKVFFGFVDTGHATKDFIEYPVADRAAIYVEQNKDWVDFIEFKDWTPEFDLKTEVGAGLCDYKKVFKVLKDMGYRGWITIEQNGTNGTKTPYECAKASIDFIRKGLDL
jgi:sugar phosphate isomerase/epimerase